MTHNEDLSKMVKITDPRLFRMAHLCIGRNDTRLFLRWILIDFDRKEVYGSDGHRLMVARCIEWTGGRTGRVMVRPEKKIPPGVAGPVPRHSSRRRPQPGQAEHRPSHRPQRLRQGGQGPAGGYFGTGAGKLS